jgi:hypothetical protein
MRKSRAIETVQLLDKFLVLVDLFLSKILRPVLRNHVDSNRISQSFFKKLVEDLNRVFGDKVAVYVQSDQLVNYLSSQTLPPGTRLVVAGGADVDFDCQKLLSQGLPEHVTFFIQHLNCKETETLKFLPIGIEDSRRARNGLGWNFSQSLRLRKKTKEVLIGPFKITDASRSELLKVSDFVPSSTVLNFRKASFVYSRIASQHRFVACPRGAGIDTHRFWETLYRGSVPIVEKSDWAANLRNYAIPCLEIDSWADLPHESLNFDQFSHLDCQNFLSTDWWTKRLMGLIVASIQSSK